MSTELIAILGVGVALAGLMLNGQYTLRAETQAEFQAVRTEMREEFKAQRKDINGLLGRMAHLEGLLEGLREAIAGRSVSVVGTAEAEDPGQYEQR